MNPVQKKYIDTKATHEANAEKLYATLDAIYPNGIPDSSDERREYHRVKNSIEGFFNISSSYDEMKKAENELIEYGFNKLNSHMKAGDVRKLNLANLKNSLMMSREMKTQFIEATLKIQ